ncbi:MAG TPA: ABC transporter ATP-binding protein [Burkholderiales bacterium]|nr:ABC transporter ATP-binding protein [Burkholderiales bacterium]
MSWCIRVEGLSKLYRIGADVQLVGTLYENLTEWMRTRVLKMPPADRGIVRRRHEHYVISESQIEDAPHGHFWALRDINFEVQQGDRVGIIGRNGSGKSTLLKILSRVTAPTEGDFRYRGRLVSLLEVGTGFHGELTGRENIFLNAQINGMTPRETKRKLDEMIEFSELAEHIDTPVKRYSSGMYMRLAFAVAAHLESEIMIVDEVLAVGDMSFQKKCSEKMLEVANAGRTVLFVSHNMEAIKNICNYGIELSHGRIVQHADRQGTTLESAQPSRGKVVTEIRSALEVTNDYLMSVHALVGNREWPDDNSAPSFDENVRLLGVKVMGRDGATRTKFDVKEDISIEMRFKVLKKKWAANAHIYIKTLTEERLLVSMDNLDIPNPDAPREPGIYVQRCTIKSPLLNEGQYLVEALICTHPTSPHNLVVPDAVGFFVGDDMATSGVRGNWIREWPRYLIRPRCTWTIEHIPAEVGSDASASKTLPASR